MPTQSCSIPVTVEQAVATIGREQIQGALLAADILRGQVANALYRAGVFYDGITDDYGWVNADKRMTDASARDDLEVSVGEAFAREVGETIKFLQSIGAPR